MMRNEKSKKLDGVVELLKKVICRYLVIHLLHAEAKVGCSKDKID